MELQQKIEENQNLRRALEVNGGPNEGGSPGYVRDRYSGSFTPPACGAPVGLPTTPQSLVKRKIWGCLAGKMIVYKALQVVKRGHEARGRENWRGGDL